MKKGEKGLYHILPVSPGPVGIVARAFDLGPWGDLDFPHDLILACGHKLGRKKADGRPSVVLQNENRNVICCVLKSTCHKVLPSVR